MFSRMPSNKLRLHIALYDRAGTPEPGDQLVEPRPLVDIPES